MKIQTAAKRLNRKVRAIRFNYNLYELNDPYFIGHEDCDQLTNKILLERWNEYKLSRQAIA